MKNKPVVRTVTSILLLSVAGTSQSSSPPFEDLRPEVSPVPDAEATELPSGEAIEYPPFTAPPVEGWRQYFGWLRWPVAWSPTVSLGPEG